ncbi:conserved hypothetical protein [Ricinus communis]|uniref:Uncharacterized protein n=1 Tax=Ricinus communis TaxID=3988 RepID=B9T7G9_RICCO|nr:conserved hypothetical protein [Ricinus communis]
MHAGTDRRRPQQFILRPGRNQPKQLRVELTSHRGRDLRGFLDGWLQPVEPRQQRALQRVRNRDRLRRAFQLVADARILQQIALENGLGQFLDEERHTVRLRDDLIEYEIRKPLAPRQPLDHRNAIAAR